MIVPGSIYISFKLDAKSVKDKKRTIVPNIGRKIVKKMVISFEGKEIVPLKTMTNFSRISTFSSRRRLDGFRRESTLTRVSLSG